MSTEPVRLDTETGYQTGGTGLQAGHKTDFLKMFKETGDRTVAIQSIGYSGKDLTAALRYDTKFREDYQAALVDMKGRIEGVMFQNAMTTRGFMDRMAWLRKHFPKEYDPKVAGLADKADKEAIDKLWKAAQKPPKTNS